MNLQEINNLIPIASQWVAVQEEFILSNGVQLTEKQMQIASKIGIKNIDKIRLLKVESIPEPGDSILNEASKGIGLISFNTIGITFRYGIYIRQDYWDNDSLIIHELVHTLQYERLGGIANFLNQYIKECVYYSYNNSPLEKEAVEISKSFCII
jgi:hypothetical protein